MEEKIYDLLMKENEVTWQDIIYNLIKTEEMDPWDVNITKLTQKYIQTVKGMNEQNFFVSGKMILASSLLLKLKSNKFIDHDISNFDSYLFHSEDELEELDDFLVANQRVKNIPPLAVKTPQARKRRVSVTDLITALEKALRVDSRRKLRLQRFFSKVPEIPKKTFDLTEMIQTIYTQIKGLFKTKDEVYFSHLLKSNSKEDKVLTLLPLLHLDTQAKIELEQNTPFEDIRINLNNS